MCEHTTRGKVGACCGHEEGPRRGVHEGFFRAGIAVTLTLGAVWGAILLLRIAWSGAFTAASLHEVNAHGHAQIFGWVGLFVMGFAFQAFPRFKGTSPVCPHLARACLVLMVAGILTRAVAEPLAGTYPWAGPLAIGASVLEVLVFLAFVGAILNSWRESRERFSVADGYILAALGWLIVQAVYEAVYLAALLGVSSREELLGLVATWQAPLRDVQIHGFALMMILGVSQVILPRFYGFRPVGRRTSGAALLAINLAIVGETTGLVLMRKLGHEWAGLWYLSTLVLAAAAAALVLCLGLFARPAATDRSLKLIRAGYVWLLVSLVLLVLLPVYQGVLLPLAAPESGAAQIGFSHAYYGATRHAITVGFISLMIVGVGARVAAAHGGADMTRLPSLWLPLVLICVGCTIRVAGQIATDFHPLAFPVAGVSGLLEVTGLTLWGVHLWPLLGGKGPRAARHQEPVVEEKTFSLPLASHA